MCVCVCVCVCVCATIDSIVGTRVETQGAVCVTIQRPTSVSTWHLPSLGRQNPILPILYNHKAKPKLFVLVSRLPYKEVLT